MKLLSRNYRVIRLALFAAALVALIVLAWRLVGAGGSSVPQTVTNGYTWGMMALAIAVLLLLWHERNRTGGYLQTSKVNAQFIAAAETSPDAFTIMESVRDKAGEIAGFRYLYVNYHAEKLLRRPRVEVLEREMCELFPTDSTHELCEKYRNVVLSGEPLGEELCIPLDNGKERWFRRRIIKLDDGVAVTVSDVTKIKNNEERYRSLTNFSNSIFETAPVSIIETDLGGMIRAMNGAAEKLTGYTRAEMVGKVSITKLHDPDELNQQTGEDAAQDDPGLQGFRLLTAKAALGEVDERDCTLHSAGRYDPSGACRGDRGAGWRGSDQRIYRDRIRHHRTKTIDDVPEAYGLPRPVDWPAGPLVAARKHRRCDREGGAGRAQGCCVRG